MLRQGAAPKNIDRPRVKGAFNRLELGRPGRIESKGYRQGTAPRPLWSESAVTNPVDVKR
jgi:hypothetical protein